MAECRRPERIFVRVRGARDIMVGEAYDYEPWFRDGKMEVCGYLPTQSRPQRDMTHEKLTSVDYTVDGLGQYADEV